MNIQVVLSSGETRSLELGADGLVVGSGAACDVVLPSAGISPRHAFFQIDPAGAPTVQEMGTASPVTVNGSRITGAVALKAADVVQVGDATFRLAPTSTPAPPAATLPPPPAATLPPPPAATLPPPPAAGLPSPAAQSSVGEPVPVKEAGSNKPLIWVASGIAAFLAVALIVFLVFSGGDDAPAPKPIAKPVPVSDSPESPASPLPVTIPSVDPPVEAQPVSKARVDGLYDGKYDFAFKASCKQGPCGGIAQSGAQFEIPYSGNSSYSGHSSLRDTCADGGVHVQAPLKVDLTFHPTDAVMVGDEWIATKVDVTLKVHRNAFKKKVRTSPTIVTTLTCNAYSKTDNFTALLAS